MGTQKLAPGLGWASVVTAAAAWLRDLESRVVQECSGAL